MVKTIKWPAILAPASLAILVIVATLVAPSFVSAAEKSPDLEGTWSGDWTPTGGIPEAVTVKLMPEENGKVTGTFLSPVQIEGTEAAYNPKTQMLTLEARDQKSGTAYKLAGKVSGTEIIGTLDIGDRAGRVRLVKWTYTGVGFK